MRGAAARLRQGDRQTRTSKTWRLSPSSWPNKTEGLSRAGVSRTVCRQKRDAPSQRFPSSSKKQKKQKLDDSREARAAKIKLSVSVRERQTDTYLSVYHARCIRTQGLVVFSRLVWHYFIANRRVTPFRKHERARERQHPLLLFPPRPFSQTSSACKRVNLAR